MNEYILKKDYDESVIKQKFNKGTELYNKGISLYVVNTDEWFCDLYSPVYYDYIKVIEKAQIKIFDNKIITTIELKDNKKIETRILLKPDGTYIAEEREL